jgi:hypothetical protein
LPVADDRGSSTPAEQVARLYEQAESQAAKASERLVGSQGFASLLGQLAENAAALTKLGNDAMDLVIRNLRVAGRRDVIRLSRQLARTEDKLERVLQEIEQLRDEIAAAQAGSSGTRRPTARVATANGRTSGEKDESAGSGTSRRRTGARSSSPGSTGSRSSPGSTGSRSRTT